MTPTERRQLRNAARWVLNEATVASREAGSPIQLSTDYEPEPAPDDQPTRKLKKDEVQP